MIVTGRDPDGAYRFTAGNPVALGVASTETPPAEGLLPPGGALQLTEEGARALAEMCKEDRGAVMGAMDKGWRQNRKRFTGRARRDYSDRLDSQSTDESESHTERELPEPEVFEVSNVSMDLSVNDHTRNSGRLARDMLGTWPFFALQPTGSRVVGSAPPDAELAKDMQRWAYHKAPKTNLLPVLRSGLRAASVRGEAVIKCQHRKVQRPFRTWATVLCLPTGEPILTSEGDVIYDSDGWDPLTSEDQVLMQDETGTPIHVLRKDPTIRRPTAAVYLEKLVAHTKVEYAGPYCQLVDFKTFHAPLNVGSLEEAGSIYEDATVSIYALREFMGIDKLGADSPAATRTYAKYARLQLTRLKEEDGTAKTPDTQDDASKSQAASPIPKEGGAMVEVCYCWRTLDVDGDGHPERLLLLLDTKQGELLWWDYAHNVTPDGLPWYRVIRQRPVENCWYGVGDFEDSEVDNDQVDWFLNRTILSSMISGLLVGYNPDACDEWQHAPPKLFTGKPCRMKSAANMEEAVTFKALPSLDANFKWAVDYLLQKHQVSQPAINPGDQGMSSLPAADLARGIEALQDSADDIYSPLLAEVEVGLKAFLELYLRVLFAHMDEQETFEYFEGQSVLLGILEREKVRHFGIDVKMSLNRGRNGDQIRKNLVMRQMVMEFYSLPAPMQDMLRPLYIEQACALEITGAEQYFSQTIAPAAAPPAAGASAPSGPAAPDIPAEGDL